MKVIFRCAYCHRAEEIESSEVPGTRVVNAPLPEGWITMGGVIACSEEHAHLALLEKRDRETA